MKTNLSTLRKPGRARAKRRLRRSRIRIAAVVDDSPGKASPTTTAQKGGRIIDPRVDAIAGSPVTAEDVNNAITGHVIEFGKALHGRCDTAQVLRVRSDNH